MNNYNKTNNDKKVYTKTVTKFTNYNGEFICQKCREKVYRARFWRDTFDFTWICDCKFVSKVNIYGRGY